MLHREPIQACPLLSRKAFWDTDRCALDFEQHARFIITRVFERGDTKDLEALLQFYGPELIASTLKAAPRLLPLARERAKRLFHLTDADFACSANGDPALYSSTY